MYAKVPAGLHKLPQQHLPGKEEKEKNKDRNQKSGEIARYMSVDFHRLREYM